MRGCTWKSAILGRSGAASFSASFAERLALTAFLLASSRAALMRSSFCARPAASSLGPFCLAAYRKGKNTGSEARTGSKRQSFAS